MRVNLDAAGGSSLHHDALEAARQALESAWADPQAAHEEGRAAASLLAHAREQVAHVLRCRPGEVSFDASLSAANRRAARGLALGRSRAGRTVVASAVEHSSMLHACAGLADGWLLGDGWEQDIVGVDETGAVDAATFVAAVNAAPTAFAALQHANSEVGTRQPVASVAAGLPDGVPLLVDASAALGVDDVWSPRWSVLTGSATHLGAPASCAVLVLREGTRWRAVDTPTDAYESGRVPGRPSIANIAAFAAALAAAAQETDERRERLLRLTTRLRVEVPALVADCVVLGAPDDRVPHTVTMSFLYVSGAALAAELDAAGFAVGSGSACSSDALTPSHVLAAMGALTEGNLRISLPWHAQGRDIDAFLSALPGCVERVRRRFGAPS